MNEKDENGSFSKAPERFENRPFSVPKLIDPADPNPADPELQRIVEVGTEIAQGMAVAIGPDLEGPYAALPLTSDVSYASVVDAFEQIEQERRALELIRRAQELGVQVTAEQVRQAVTGMSRSRQRQPKQLIGTIGVEPPVDKEMNDWPNEEIRDALRRIDAEYTSAVDQAARMADASSVSVSWQGIILDAFARREQKREEVTSGLAMTHAERGTPILEERLPWFAVLEDTQGRTVELAVTASGHIELLSWYMNKVTIRGDQIDAMMEALTRAKALIQERGSK